ncbi:septum site-determining protein MinC [Deinococcus psychrotolerans]|uniref:Septum site-determining protein MinC n=1 Tax=Deinococcus psychrotolerans TaxID=2489213 RepID=A0A3G8Y949_9DEIO|nr:septum site-determining protein MinC [Deinococcus psychrotolerans]AZI41892.1 septum site-determining protein MinC [Deinococcus psychrotolerans]
MKFRGTLGGLNIQLDDSDTPQSVAGPLAARAALLASEVTLEIDIEAHLDTLDAVRGAVAAAGGSISRVRAPRVTAPSPALITEQGSAPSSSSTALPTAALPVGNITQSLDNHTVVLPNSVRAGFRGEYGGSVVVLGDVNPGSELVAGGDVIVLGALRGVVHAGADGRESAIVWGRPIASPQIRIAGAVARAPEGSSLSSMRKLSSGVESEVARLQHGQIVIEASHVPR